MCCIDEAVIVMHRLSQYVYIKHNSMGLKRKPIAQMDHDRIIVKHHITSSRLAYIITNPDKRSKTGWKAWKNLGYFYENLHASMTTVDLNKIERRNSEDNIVTQ